MKQTTIVKTSLSLLLLIPALSNAKPGPISGWIAYTATKGIIWGVTSAAINHVIRKTITPNPHAQFGGHVIYRGVEYINGVPGGLAANISRSAVQDYGYDNAAAETGTAVISIVGGGAAVGLVESAAVGVGAFFTSLPFLP